MEGLLQVSVVDELESEHWESEEQVGVMHTDEQQIWPPVQGLAAWWRLRIA